MATIIILSVVWFLFASLDGFVQAHYYDLFPSTNKGHRNLHPYYTIVRMIVAGLMCYEVYMLGGEGYYIWANAAIFGVALIMTFSFWHNGFYYLTRRKLSNSLYPNGFADTSNSSTAMIELNFKWRTSFFILGMCFIIGVILQST